MISLVALLGLTCLVSAQADLAAWQEASPWQHGTVVVLRRAGETSAVVYGSCSGEAGVEGRAQTQSAVAGHDENAMFEVRVYSDYARLFHIGCQEYYHETSPNFVPLATTVRGERAWTLKHYSRDDRRLSKPVVTQTVQPIVTPTTALSDRLRAKLYPQWAHDNRVRLHFAESSQRNLQCLLQPNGAVIRGMGGHGLWAVWRISESPLGYVTLFNEKCKQYLSLWEGKIGTSATSVVQTHLVPVHLEHNKWMLRSAVNRHWLLAIDSRGQPVYSYLQQQHHLVFSVSVDPPASAPVTKPTPTPTPAPVSSETQVHTNNVEHHRCKQARERKTRVDHDQEHKGCGAAFTAFVAFWSLCAAYWYLWRPSGAPAEKEFLRGSIFSPDAVCVGTRLRDGLGWKDGRVLDVQQHDFAVRYKNHTFTLLLNAEQMRVRCAPFFGLEPGDTVYIRVNGSISLSKAVVYSVHVPLGCVWDRVSLEAVARQPSKFCVLLKQNNCDTFLQLSYGTQAADMRIVKIEPKKRYDPPPAKPDVDDNQKALGDIEPASTSTVSDSHTEDTADEDDTATHDTTHDSDSDKEWQEMW